MYSRAKQNITKQNKSVRIKETSAGLLCDMVVNSGQSPHRGRENYVSTEGGWKFDGRSQ